MTVEIKRILFATDLTENAARAFEVASTLAKRWDASMALVHVTKRLPASEKQQMALLGSRERLLHLEEEHRKHVKDVLIGKKREAEMLTGEQLDPYCSLEGLQEGDRLLEIRLKEGDPAEQILSIAVEEGCDLIVMGAHSRLWGRTVLGSVAQRVLQESRVPVVVVP